MQLIYGHYTSPGDATEYEYDATWHIGQFGLTWNATVHTPGQRPSYPTGTMTGTDPGAGESLVRAAIANAIHTARSIW